MQYPLNPLASPAKVRKSLVNKLRHLHDASEHIVRRIGAIQKDFGRADDPKFQAASADVAKASDALYCLADMVEIEEE